MSRVLLMERLRHRDTVEQPPTQPVATIGVEVREGTARTIHVLIDTDGTVTTKPVDALAWVSIIYETQP